MINQSGLEDWFRRGQSRMVTQCYFKIPWTLIIQDRLWQTGINLSLIHTQSVARLLSSGFSKTPSNLKCTVSLSTCIYIDIGICINDFSGSLITNNISPDTTRALAECEYYQRHESFSRYKKYSERVRSSSLGGNGRFMGVAHGICLKHAFPSTHHQLLPTITFESQPSRRNNAKSGIKIIFQSISSCVFVGFNLFFLWLILFPLDWFSFH